MRPFSPKNSIPYCNLYTLYPGSPKNKLCPLVVGNPLFEYHPISASHFVWSAGLPGCILCFLSRMPASSRITSEHLRSDASIFSFFLFFANPPPCFDEHFSMKDPFPQGNEPWTFIPCRVLEVIWSPFSTLSWIQNRTMVTKKMSKFLETNLKHHKLRYKDVGHAQIPKSSL